MQQQSTIKIQRPKPACGTAVPCVDCNYEEQRIIPSFLRPSAIQLYEKELQYYYFYLLENKAV